MDNLRKALEHRIDEKLEKAKYISRTKGKDGKWKYVYARPKTGRKKLSIQKKIVASPRGDKYSFSNVGSGNEIDIRGSIDINNSAGLHIKNGSFTIMSGGRNYGGITLPKEGNIDVIADKVFSVAEKYAKKYDEELKITKEEMRTAIRGMYSLETK